ncbi:MAG: DJ-1/PfpI family protein [Bacteroides sp.]
MKTVYVFLANGFEEIEAITTIDVLRRAGLTVKSVSITKNKSVIGAHHITVEGDSCFEENSFDDVQMLILPGGMPGATNLSNHAGLRQLLLKSEAANKPIAAICAAPFVLGRLGLLKGKQVTCYPSFENELIGANYTGASVELSDTMITGNGPGATMEFALTIVKELCGEAKAREIAAGMIVN